MFVVDAIDKPPEISPMVLAAESGQGKNNAQEQERSIGVCYVVGKNAEENLRHQIPVVPWSDVSRYFEYFEQREIRHPYGTEGHHDEVSSRVLQQPAHGTLVEVEWHNGDTHYFYEADKGYYGEDRAVILGEVNGHKVNIHAYYHVVEGRTFNMYEICGDTGLLWKISRYLDGLTPKLEGLELEQDATFIGLAFSTPGEVLGEGFNTMTMTSAIAADFR